MMTRFGRENHFLLLNDRDDAEAAQSANDTRSVCNALAEGAGGVNGASPLDQLVKPEANYNSAFQRFFTRRALCLVDWGAHSAPMSRSSSL